MFWKQRNRVRVDEPYDDSDSDSETEPSGYNKPSEPRKSENPVQSAPAEDTRTHPNPSAYTEPDQNTSKYSESEHYKHTAAETKFRSLNTRSALMSLLFSLLVIVLIVALAVLLLFVLFSNAAETGPADPLVHLPASQYQLKIDNRDSTTAILHEELTTTTSSKPSTTSNCMT